MAMFQFKMFSLLQFNKSMRDKRDDNFIILLITFMNVLFVDSILEI